MDTIPLWACFTALAILFMLSAFFSGSETALIALNRYRLNHSAEQGVRGARYAQEMLERPDRLIGVILLGNNLVNILITQVAGYIGFRLAQDYGLGMAITSAITTVLLTIFLLIFAELTPKTLAATKTEQVAYPASYILRPFMSKYSPAVWIAWMVNYIANNLLSVFGVDAKSQASLALNSEELKTVVNQGNLIPENHQTMLGNVLDLEHITVEDIMIPRNELVGIDIEQEWDEILNQIMHSEHTRLPVFRETMDNIIGFVHLRKFIVLMERGTFNRNSFEALIRDAYFVPEGTSLARQLLAFQHEKRRVGLVVDEYGDIQGLITLEDILEEIVGEFTTDPSTSKDLYRQHDGSYLVDGGAHVRDINKELGWHLPTDGPKTLNGVITEYLETIPVAGTSLRLAGHTLEVMISESNAIKTVRLVPKDLGEQNKLKVARAAKKSSGSRRG